MSIAILSDESSNDTIVYDDLPDISNIRKNCANMQSSKLPKAYLDLTLEDQDVDDKSQPSSDVLFDYISKVNSEQLQKSQSSTKSTVSTICSSRVNSGISSGYGSINGMDLVSNDAMFDQMFYTHSEQSQEFQMSTGSVGSTAGRLNVNLKSHSGSNNGDRKCNDGSEDTLKRKTVRSEEMKAKKQILSEEKAHRQAARECNRMYKPGECMKYMNIELHPTLIDAWYCADLKREAEAVGARVSPTPSIVDPHFVLWSRRVQPALAVNDRVVELTSATQPCDRALYIATDEEIKPIISTLSQFMLEKRAMLDCELTLVIFLGSHNSKTRSKSKSASMNKLELDIAFTDLLASAVCDVSLVNTPNELALLIVQFTKAIAEAPYKQAKCILDGQAGTHIRRDNPSVAVDKDGHGLSRLWQQMISVLPNSSLEVARAICKRYKSPLEMYEAVQSSTCIDDLINLEISRTNIPGSRARRLGPEFVRKLRALFTAENGHALLE